MKTINSLSRATTRTLLILSLIFIPCLTVAQAQTTAFTYQGRLTDSQTTSGGSYLMEFRLFAASAGGNAIQVLTDVPVTVTNNVFTVQLDFTAADAFEGAERFLEIAVKRTANDPYTTLNPRQPVTNVPYSIRAQKSATADVALDAKAVGGTAANQIIKEGDGRLLRGSEGNLYAGAGAGAFANEMLSGSTFVGVNAGYKNTSGYWNSFFGLGAGFNNTTGLDNTFFGKYAGYGNEFGVRNSFFGVNAGFSGTGSRNSFFGGSAGYLNTGTENSFFGTNAGYNNTSGKRNTMIGSYANVGAEGLQFATAIGARAVVASSDTIVLGKTAGNYFGEDRPADAVQIPGNLSVNNTLSVTAPDNTAEALTITNPQPNSANALNNLLLRMRSSAGNTTTLTDKFKFDIAGGFVALGQIGVGTIPATGAGLRLMWHPNKGAFRFGEATAAGEFDNLKIGQYSFAGGSGTVAGGNASFAFGNRINVQGANAVGFGGDGSVSGSYGFSAGNNNECVGFACIAIGDTAKAQGSAAVALGH